VTPVQNENCEKGKIVYLRCHPVWTPFERKHGGRRIYLFQNNHNLEMIYIIKLYI